MSSGPSSCKVFQVVYHQRVPAPETSWADLSDWQAVFEMLEKLSVELAGLGVVLNICEEPVAISIRGYGDILNSIRLRYPPSGFANTCLGHVIGRSVDCHLATDLKRGINRLIFAPETIEPQGSDRIVCHNCGCGC